jgi:hypothetical protein
LADKLEIEYSEDERLFKVNIEKKFAEASPELADAMSIYATPGDVGSKINKLSGALEKANDEGDKTVFIFLTARKAPIMPYY